MRNQLQVAVPALAEESAVFAAIVPHPGHVGVAAVGRRPQVLVEAARDRRLRWRAERRPADERRAADQQLASIYVPLRRLGRPPLSPAARSPRKRAPAAASSSRSSRDLIRTPISLRKPAAAAIGAAPP